MKKFLLSLFAFVAVAANVMAGDPVLTVTFPMTDQESVSSYSKQWTGKDVNGGTWTFNYFNNNNNAWQLIKCGWKTEATTSTITSPLVSEAISTLVITFDQTSKVTAAKVDVLEDDGESVVETKTFTPKAGEQAITLTGTANCIYKITLDNEKTSSNGTTVISKIQLFGNGGYDAGSKPTIENTPETAYTVAEAVALIDKGEALTDVVYVKGKVSQVDSYNSTYKSITFWISADGTTENQFECYSCKGIGGADFAAKEDVNLGAEVIVKGQLKKYGEIYEFNQGCEIVSMTGGVEAIKAPTITVDGAIVTITAAEGYGIIYTIDGTTPQDGNGTAVTGNYVQFTAESSCTVKAITVDNDDPDNCSSVASASVTVTKVFNTPETALTVGEALAFIEAGDKLDQYVYTKGEIHYITEVSLSNGNATYSITDGTDTLIVYRGKGLDNVKIAAEDDIYVGDKVVVYGLLVNYKDITPEYTTGNYIVSQEKVERPTTIDPNDPFNDYVVTADGSLANPYTAKDLVYFYKKNAQKYPEGKQWVKGTIYGSVKSFSKDECILQEEAVASNIALGDADFKVGVALPTGGVRTALNVMDNADNVGKEVWVYGDIAAYFSFVGVKNVTDFSLDGVNQFTGISSIAAEAQNAAIVNLAGQKVGKGYKGIVIIGGKKIVR